MILLNGNCGMYEVDYGKPLFTLSEREPQLLSIFATYKKGMEGKFKAYSDNRVMSIGSRDMDTITDTDLPMLQWQVFRMVNKEWESPLSQFIIKKYKEVSSCVIEVSTDFKYDNCVDVIVKVLMPKYDKQLMRQLVSVEIEVDKLAWKYNYQISFTYVPITEIRTETQDKTRLLDL